MERRFTRWPFARASLDVDVLAICALFTVALGLRAWWLFVQQPTQITWDGAEYARAAENVLAGHGYVGLRGGLLYVFPPLYTLTIAAAMLFAHGGEGAGILISMLSGAALVIPVYVTANLVYGRRAALLAGTIAAVLPFAVDLSVLVLADALFLTLASAGLYYTLRTLSDVRATFAASAGLAYGLAYLARPEGAVLEAAGIAAILLAASLDRAALRRFAACAAVSMASFTLLAAPYVTFLSIHAGHLRIESKSAVNAAIAVRMHRGLSYTAAGDAIDDRLNEVGPELDEGYFFNGAVPAGTWRERTSVALDAARRHLVEIPRLLMSKSYGTPLLLLAVASGLASGPRTRRRRVLELGIVCYVLGLFAALSSVYHFWDRYADGFIPVLAIWGGYGLERLRAYANAGLARLRTRFQVPGQVVAAAATLGAIVILFTLRSSIRDFANDSATLTERVAGERLRPYTVRSDRVFSISAQSVYYADATWLMLPYTVHAQTALAYVREKHPQWLILDREYAGERPYVLEWLRTGIPDTHARLIATVGDPRHPDAAVYRWSAHL